jgi:ribosome-associated protein
VTVVDPIQVRGKVIPADELSWRFSRSSGPGGQSVNTSDSRVELSYDVAASSALGPVLRERALRALADRLVNGVLTISASEQRSQLRNREAASRRLAGVLTAATAPPAVRRPTKRTRGSQERRLAAKQRRSQIKRLRRSTDD